MTKFVPQSDPKDFSKQSGTPPEAPEKKKEYNEPGFREMTIEEAREMLKKNGIDLDELIKSKKS
jgi:hypothetical protein